MTLPPHILVVEDDAKIADMLTNYLHMHGYTTATCADGLLAVDVVRLTRPALVLLDLMLPGQDGLAVCTQVRNFSQVPIIMLTARIDEIDRLLGLETGADDYVCKPFSPREVVARVKALLRRAQGVWAHAPHPGAGSPALEVRESALSIYWAGAALPLTPVEYRLLATLLARPEQVFSRAQLLDHVHEDLRDVSDRAIDSHIKNIRKKLEVAGVHHCGIHAVYGVGYRLGYL
jgi:two-component system response regulator BaeR